MLQTIPLYGRPCLRARRRWRSSMQRAFWITILVASLVLAGKLVFKPPAYTNTPPRQYGHQVTNVPSDGDTEKPIEAGDEALVARYSDERELVARLLDR